MANLDSGLRAAPDDDGGEGNGAGAAAAGLPDRYRVRRRLGAGADGSPVVLAVDARDGGLVVVKRAAPGESAGREMEILGALRHPGVVRLKDWHEAPDATFLVTEFVDGPDLEAFLASRAGRLDRAALRALLVGLADAVEAVHAAGFLHRDLKPANVLVRPDGTPVLVDFGAAVAIGGGAALPSPWSSLTDGYAAPEQYLTDEPEGPWTDVYGLGAIAYRALTGRPPPPAPARRRGEPTATADDVGGADDGLRGAVDWALALEPGGRPRTVAAWRDALTSIGRPAARRPGPATDRAEKVEDEADDYPPTVRVQRVPGREVSRRRAVVDGPREPDAPPHRRRRARPLAALLLLAAALGAGLAAAAWYGRPVYERHFKNEWLVDPAGGGDVATIADALARARDGATVLIRPGTYAESLILDRPLHLRAAVPDEAPVIAPEEGGGPCLLATAAGATVSGLRLRSPAPAADADEGAAPAVACLEVAGGDLRVEASAITGGAVGPAVLIRDGAAPVIVGNAIEESAGPGIVALAGARGLIADNRIANVAGHSLVVRSGAEPEVTNNIIEGGGVVFAEGARGTFARNRLLSARASAIEVTTGADPLVADNHIEQPGEAGIFVHDLGRGAFKGNTVIGSGVSGVVIASGGAPRLEENTIQGSGEHGVLVIDRGGGVLERNAIANSGGHGIAVGPDAGVDLIDNRLDGNSQEPQLLDARAG